MEHNAENEGIEDAEFDFSIPLKRPNQNLYKRHEELKKLLGIPPGDKFLEFIFKTVISLCDPFTQPEEKEQQILSVDCVSDLLISIVFYFFKDQMHVDLEVVAIESLKFEISTHLFTLIQYINKLLNCEDELKTRFINNDEVNYIENLKFWTPKISHEFNLKLLYSIECVLILSIYKLAAIKDSNDEYNLILNPYLHYFLKLWKCHTNIILLGLEIDRRIEFKNHETGSDEKTPSIVQQTLKGSSSIRYVLAWILNQNPSSIDDNEEEEEQSYKDTLDLKNETIFNFIQPLARKKDNGGALTIDMRLIIIALLVLYSGTSFTVGQYDENEKSKNDEHASRRLNRSKPIAEIGDVLLDLEYADRFDEDIKYMLEYEFDDYEEDDYEEGDSSVADDLSVASGGISDLEEKLANIEFDELGRDWRDVPRDDNRLYKKTFMEKYARFDSLKDKSDSDDFLLTWDELYSTFEFLIVNSIEENLQAEQKLGQAVINTIAKSIGDNDRKESDVENSNSNPQIITPSKIYNYFISSASEESIRQTQDNNKSIVPIFNVSKFELLLHNNSKLARAAMDEMLMYGGFRRLLIWFITHDLNLSSLLIDYVFQLASGLRGNKNSDYNFSRQGQCLVLSDVELSMVLHEFLTNSSVYLSATTDGIEIENGYKVVLAESIAKKLMQMLCLMINQLINLGIINVDEENEDIHDYKNELQILLINWIGKVPEARQLFFKIKNANYEEKNKEEKETKENNNIEITNFAFEQEEELIKAYAYMSIDEISFDLHENQTHMNIIKSFARRIEKDIQTVLSPTIEVSTQVTIHFRFFIENFNTLCKIEELAELLFDRFEPVISTGLILNLGQGPLAIDQADVQVQDEYEAEFSTDFLNGDVSYEKDNNKKKKKK
ncbi:unnamed protein product [Candida verbasci]|uniref:Uncharacterized protein n=1 Tax=Candida verbasci TaxID=1227364 RepID=A0A9W4XKQ6_9ASCO|nr:unnamed protein product [Candida verbasci]